MFRSLPRSNWRECAKRLDHYSKCGHSTQSSVGRVFTWFRGASRTLASPKRLLSEIYWHVLVFLIRLVPSTPVDDCNDVKRLPIREAVDQLPSCLTQDSHIDSHVFVINGHSQTIDVTQPVTKLTVVKSQESVENSKDGQGLTPVVANCPERESGGSDGARTRPD